MTNSQIFKTKFPGFIDAIDFYTTDGEQLNFIDVDNDIVEFTTKFTEECGCCSGIDEQTEGLDYIMDYMSDSEFEELCNLISKKV